MDFLEIRRKAKERAAAEEAERARAAGRVTEGARQATPAASPDASPDPGASAAAPEGARDERFWTWRPGTGPPVVSPAPARLPPEAPGSSGEPPAPRTPANPLDDFFYSPDEPGPDLPELALPAAAAPAPAPVVREEYLTFLLGAEEYAVAIERVREVVKAPAIVEVPRAPAHVLGVVAVRGEVVAVFDTRQRLALPPATPAEGGRIVVVDAGEGPCGLLVDRVASVVRLPRGSVEPCPQGVAGPNAGCIAGVGREQGRIFTILDVPALVRAPSRQGRGRAHGTPR